MTIKRRYLHIDELATKTGVSAKDIIHGAAHGDFPLYVLANNWDVIAYKQNPDDETWGRASPSKSKYSGPIRLYPDDIMRFEADPSAKITRLMGDTAGYIGLEPDEEWEFRLEKAPIQLSNCAFVIMEKDFNALIKEATKSTPSKSPKRTKQAKPPAPEADSLAASEMVKAWEMVGLRPSSKDFSSTPDLSEMPSGTYLRVSDLTKILSMSRSTIWRKTTNGSFPASVRLSEKVIAWRVGDIREWLEKNKK